MDSKIWEKGTNFVDIQSFYKSFMKVADTLNKFKAKQFNFSKGVFSCYEEGIMTIITFSEKIEKDILELFPFKFDIYAAAFKFVEKYMRIQDIIFSNKGMQFIYGCDNPKAMYDDKNFSKHAEFITKKDNNYCIEIQFGKTELYEKIVSILNYIKNADFDNAKEFTIDIYKELSNSEIPFTIEDDRFYTRLSKSTFQNVTKGDVAKVKCVPYADKNSLVFLTVTTVNKSDYQILNIFNVLYLSERDE